MAAQVLFNPLPYIDRLTRGGFSPDQARAHAEALETAFAESVATKRDLIDVKIELEQKISDVQHALQQDIATLKLDNAALRTELKQDISTLKQDNDKIRIEIEKSKNDTIRWVFGFTLLLIGAMFTMLKFLH